MGDRPLIGLIPSYENEEDRQAVNMRYVRAVLQAGGAPFVLPLCDDAETVRKFAQLCDGVLFTGGDDVHPRYYGCCLHEHCGTLTPIRDSFEIAFAKEFLKSEKPFLGICRGIQLINVMYGGTLYQDICAEYKAGCAHRQSAPYNVPFHSVSLVKGGALEALCGKTDLQVNSMHHQSVKALGKHLSAEAFAPDGVVEALSATDRAFGVAVQWHPEHLAEKGDTASLKLFEAFVGAAKKD